MPAARPASLDELETPLVTPTLASPSPLTDAELAAVRREHRSASLLPPRVFHDPAILEFEREQWFARDWLAVGREEEAANPGEYFLAQVADESVVIVRGQDRRLRAFYNVCRHRGTPVLEEPCGRIVRFQCPYHAWVYDLEGQLQRAKHTDDLVEFEPAENSLVPVRCETWQGFVFLSLDPAAQPLLTFLDDLVDHFERFNFASLRRARRLEYDVRANWKVIAENYSECLHCPGVHPQLNRLTPYDLGGDYDADGPWKGGWMELVGPAETMSVDGANHGRPPLPGMIEADLRRIYYYVVWPNLLVSVHPDYLMVHHVWPVEPGLSKVYCDFYFDPSTIAAPGFDPSDATGFWDQTNRQDWHVCELQQQGTRSRAYTAGRYTNQEDSVHAFDLMCADRYAGDGIRTDRGSRHEADGTAGQPIDHRPGRPIEPAVGADRRREARTRSAVRS
jgi:glycine betaine catabolism A